jgi:hypothetical protein
MLWQMWQDEQDTLVAEGEQDFRDMSHINWELSHGLRFHASDIGDAIRVTEEDAQGEVLAAGAMDAHSIAVVQGTDSAVISPSRAVIRGDRATLGGEGYVPANDPQANLAARKENLTMDKIRQMKDMNATELQNFCRYYGTNSKRMAEFLKKRVYYAEDMYLRIPGMLTEEDAELTTALANRLERMPRQGGYTVFGEIDGEAQNLAQLDGTGVAVEDGAESSTLSASGVNAQGPAGTASVGPHSATFQVQRLTRGEQGLVSA